jgi:hypothetical protein
VARHGATAVETAAEPLPSAAADLVRLALANARAWQVQQAEAVVDGAVQ